MLSSLPQSLARQHVKLATSLSRSIQNAGVCVRVLCGCCVCLERDREGARERESVCIHAPVWSILPSSSCVAFKTGRGGGRVCWGGLLLCLLLFTLHFVAERERLREGERERRGTGDRERVRQGGTGEENACVYFCLLLTHNHLLLPTPPLKTYTHTHTIPIDGHACLRTALSLDDKDENKVEERV